MYWQEIKNTTPNFPKQVLLGFFKGDQVGHAVGTLGGSQNSPKIAMYRDDGSEYELIATHWAEFDTPYLEEVEDCTW